MAARKKAAKKPQRKSTDGKRGPLKGAPNAGEPPRKLDYDMIENLASIGYVLTDADLRAQLLETAKGELPRKASSLFFQNDEDGKWYFWNEVWTDTHGPYETPEEASATLSAYADQL